MTDPTKRYLAAAIQMHAGEDKAANLDAAGRLVTAAARDGASLVVLPEFFNCLTQLQDVVRQAEPIPGETSRRMSQLAAELEIVLVAGSICERSGQQGKGHNTSLIFGPDGRQLSIYRKLHLFDVTLPDRVRLAESEHILPGDRLSAVDSPAGRLGQAICYDLRFPELFRGLVDRQMEVLVFPSAFSKPTGEAHWEVLLRARAIENQCYIVAADQYGSHTPNFSTYGRSMIVDPWGTVLAAADVEGETIVTAQIDLGRLAEVRAQLPALAHRRHLGATNSSG